MRRGFDPDQPRDRIGRWSDGPGGDLDRIEADVETTVMGSDGRNRSGLPADPLAAILDPADPFDSNALLDELAGGRGDAQERAGLAEAFREYRSLYRGMHAADPAVDTTGATFTPDRFGSIVRGMLSFPNDPEAQARAILSVLDDRPGNLPYRAYVISQLEDRRAEKAGPGGVGLPNGPQFADNRQAREWATGHMPPPPGLTDRERVALRDYTGGVDGPSSKNINRALRTGEITPGWESAIALHVEDIDMAIARSTLPADVVLMRGEDESGLRSLGVDPADPAALAGLVGQVVSDPAYTSTTIGTRPGGAGTAGGHVTWAFRTPAGTPGIFMNEGMSAWAEGEVLLPRGTRRIVHGAYRSPDPSDMRIYIEAEIVPDGWEPPADWRPTPRGDMWKEYRRW